TLQLQNYRSLPDRGLNHGAERIELRSERAARESEPPRRSILFAPLLFAQTLPRKRFLCSAFLAGLHVEAVLLDFFDDVFLLHLALETAQRIFQRLILLNNDFSH